MSSQRERLVRELGEPSEVRAKRERLQRALIQVTQEPADIRDELAEHEVHTPGTWAVRSFGERPIEPRLRTEWEQGVRQVARYRLQYDITHPDDPLGPEPQPREHQHDRQRARDALDRSARHLGRDVSVDHDLGVEIGP